MCRKLHSRAFFSFSYVSPYSYFLLHPTNCPQARAASPVRKGASPTKLADASEKEKREVETYLSKPRAVIYVEDGTASVSSKATLRTLDVRFVVLPGMP